MPSPGVLLGAEFPSLSRKLEMERRLDFIGPAERFQQFLPAGIAMAISEATLKASSSNPTNDERYQLPYSEMWRCNNSSSQKNPISPM
ncbi:Uncharacterized protein HZ326_8300 [Fusarium oxysporum f. sp. albedinis]|nr:Uncharacterized protein HZ326_8300 [Fusarium oxysporum f. sp. albedinis]